MQTASVWVGVGVWGVWGARENPGAHKALGKEKKNPNFVWEILRSCFITF